MTFSSTTIASTLLLAVAFVVIDEALAGTEDAVTVMDDTDDDEVDIDAADFCA